MKKDFPIGCHVSLVDDGYIDNTTKGSQGIVQKHQFEYMANKPSKKYLIAMTVLLDDFTLILAEPWAVTRV